MALLFKEEYYDAVRPYMPEEARKILDQQIPEIRAKIDTEIKTFAASLAKEIAKEVEELAKQQRAADAAFKASLTARVAALAASQANGDVKKLLEDAKLLTTEVDAYQKKLTDIGGMVRTAAKTALKAANIPGVDLLLP